MAVKNVTLNDVGNVLSTPFMTSASRSLIKAGWQGNIEDFSKKLLKFAWPRTRDYTMAVIMLTVVVAASKAEDITVEAKVRDDKGKKTDTDENLKLSEYINRKVSLNKIAKLFEKIVNIKKSGDSNNIASYISKEDKPHGWFAKCFMSLLLGSDSNPKKEEIAKRVFGNFLKQVKKMTRWKINYSYMLELTGIINNALKAEIKCVEPCPTPETKEEIAQENIEMKTLLKLPAKSDTGELSDEDISMAQVYALDEIRNRCEESGSPFFEPPKEDKFLQYYLTSYQLEHGKKQYRDGVLYCHSFVPPEGVQMDVGTEFEIDKYVYENLPPHHFAKKMAKVCTVFKIKVPQRYSWLRDENCNSNVIPPHTKFRVVEKGNQKYNIYGEHPKTLTKLTVTLEVVDQKDPAVPTDKEIGEMVSSTYELSKKDQMSSWESLMKNPDIFVCFRPADESQAEESGKKNIVMLKSSAPLLQYFNLLAQLQRQKMDSHDIGHLYSYTKVGDCHGQKQLQTIDAIFDKIDALKRSLTVFRGMDADEMDAIIESYKKKKVFSDFQTYAKDGGNWFLSTSVDPLVAMAYMNGGYAGRPKGKGLLKLTIPCGRKALVAEPTGYSLTRNREMILRRKGLRIKINNVVEKNGFSFIDATVL